jgi:hypothetical protein
MQRGWLTIVGFPSSAQRKRFAPRETAPFFDAHKSATFGDPGDVLHTECGLVNPASLTAESGTFYLRLMCIRTDVLSAWYHNLLEYTRI